MSVLHETPPALLEVRLRDSGAPRGEPRWWHITVGNDLVFETRNGREARELADRLGAAIAKATGSAA